MKNCFLDFRLHYRSGIWLAVVFLIIVGAGDGILSMRAARKLLDTNKWVEHSRMVGDELDDTLIAMLNLETGERGYLYTGERQYLEPYEIGKQEIDSHLARLEVLTSENPAQQQNLSRLRVSVQGVIGSFQRAIALQAAGRYQEAQEFVLGGTGKAEMDAVRTTLGEMKAEELRLLAILSAEAQQSQHYLLLAIPALHLAMGMLLIGAGALASRHLGKRVESFMLNEKLATVNRMASAVAHEINNPLEAITNLIWLAGNDPTASQSVRTHLAMADYELRKIAHATRQACAFYMENSEPTEVNVGEVVNNVLGLYAGRITGKQISVRIRNLDHDLLGYTEELRQMLANLCANAIDALGTRGTLSIKKSRAVCRPDEPGVLITVADNGSGIRPEHLDSIFEPFFTTKESTSTGLGLWVAKQIAEKHGGRITVRSRATANRHYTVVSVFLPALNEGWRQDIAVAA